MPSTVLRAIRVAILLVAGTTLLYLVVISVLNWVGEPPVEVRLYELIAIVVGLLYLGTAGALAAGRQGRVGTVATVLVLAAIIGGIIGLAYVRGLN